MSTLDVALQLEWSHVLPIAMLACCVAFPALTVLLFQLQVVLHMVHEPAREGRQIKQCQKTQRKDPQLDPQAKQYAV